MRALAYTDTPVIIAPFSGLAYPSNPAVSFLLQMLVRGSISTAPIRVYMMWIVLLMHPTLSRAQTKILLHFNAPFAAASVAQFTGNSSSRAGVLSYLMVCAHTRTHTHTHRTNTHSPGHTHTFGNISSPNATNTSADYLRFQAHSGIFFRRSTMCRVAMPATLIVSATWSCWKPSRSRARMPALTRPSACVVIVSFY